MLVKFKSKTYEISLPQTLLVRPLVAIQHNDLVTELLHPIDCLRLGAHNGGYFHSQQSHNVHNGESVLSDYFSDSELSLLPSYYSSAATYAGCAYRNYFGLSASSTLEQWTERGWIQPGAPEGWFEAYTLYCYLQSTGGTCSSGKLPGFNGLTVDWLSEQKRMLSFASRHGAQVIKACAGDLTKRRKQRQALLNWASPLAFA